MAVYQTAYQLWRDDPYFDEETRRELRDIAEDPREIEDRFYRHLNFGTGGMRGIIGAGTNRMNRYTVRLVTRGLAEYIDTFGENARRRGVVIAYDSRHFSREFALETALTLCASGVTAYLWDELRPTPMLSYGVRVLGAIAGVMITASHNPPEYNGYKVYWEDGGQVHSQRAEAIRSSILGIEDITAIVPMAEEEARGWGLLKPVPAWVDDRYVEQVVELASTRLEERAACRVLFTPLHGTGTVPVQRVLTQAGFPFSVVAAQAVPDPEFSTVPTPNPEDPVVFSLALEQAQAEAPGQPDVIIGSDPDADRLGLLARDKDGKYRHFTGNQIGAVLVDYLLCSRPVPFKGAVIKSIASSNLVAPLCQQRDVTVVECHTGFKFIGDKIREYEQTGEHSFVFGFEESYGYLAATFVRDKDAVMAALLVADAVAYHKARGRTLCDALEDIWQRCGYFAEELHDVKLPGQEGQARIQALMEGLRAEPPTEFGGIPVAYSDDYAQGTGVDLRRGTSYRLALSKANVLHYRFADGGFVMVRPSGTEPKLKVYFSVTAPTREEAEQRLAAVRTSALAQMGLK